MSDLLRSDKGGEQTSVYLYLPLIKAARERAEHEGRSLSWLIRQALAEYLTKSDGKGENDES